VGLFLLANEELMDMRLVEDDSLAPILISSFYIPTVIALRRLFSSMFRAGFRQGQTLFVLGVKLRDGDVILGLYRGAENDTPALLTSTS
jgi:hypothetical protein